MCWLNSRTAQFVPRYQRPSGDFIRMIGERVVALDPPRDVDFQVSIALIGRAASRVDVAAPVQRWRSRRDERRTDERQRSKGDQYGESEHEFSQGGNSPGDVPEIGVPADAVDRAGTTD